MGWWVGFRERRNRRDGGLVGSIGFLDRWICGFDWFNDILVRVLVLDIKEEERWWVRLGSNSWV